MLRDSVEASGFVVERGGTTQHVPRLLLMSLGACANRRIVRGAAQLEKLDRLPTRELTGQFVGVLARSVP